MKTRRCLFLSLVVLTTMILDRVDVADSQQQLSRPNVNGSQPQSKKFVRRTAPPVDFGGTAPAPQLLGNESSATTNTIPSMGGGKFKQKYAEPGNMCWDGSFKIGIRPKELCRSVYLDTQDSQRLVTVFFFMWCFISIVLFQFLALVSTLGLRRFRDAGWIALWGGLTALGTNYSFVVAAMYVNDQWYRFFASQIWHTAVQAFQIAFGFSYFVYFSRVLPAVNLKTSVLPLTTQTPEVERQEEFVSKTNKVSTSLENSRLPTSPFKFSWWPHLILKPWPMKMLLCLSLGKLSYLLFF